MIRLDVRHDPCVRRQCEESAITLVSLGDEVGATAVMGIAAALVELTANSE
ncbi:unannotated protein [freshwater metagenome]|uniref:Unannotated protein n=1 Tax=freshwater metagenome TaxID=449393 RepID=A0A6J7BU40_9ZZZZ